MRNNCCVKVCHKSIPPYRRIPHPVSDHHHRFGKWLAVLGNEQLHSMEPMRVYTHKRVCDMHFSPDCYIPGTNKLKRNTIPNLLLPALLISVPSPSIGVECIEGDTSHSHSTPTASCVPLEVGFLPSPITSQLETESSQKGVMETPKARRSLFHETDSECSGRRRGILQRIGVKKVIELTPKAKFLYRTSQRLRRRMFYTSKVLVSARRRLELANKALKRGCLSDISSLPQTVSSFLACQLREASKKSKGHRFTLDEKVLALSLLKRSGRAYSFLSKVFILPSRRTLLRLLSCLSFSAGINNAMFDHMSLTIQNMVKPKDRYCILMFDEMSITPHLDFQEHLGVIEGFEDVGWERRPRLADKALVFMVRGLRRKFKQPVLYAFLSGSVKTPDLCRLIKDVVFHLSKVGFHVCATVCDQGASNVAAINHLCTETRQSVLRSGGEYRGEYFTVYGREVIPLFDPPHLLKGVRNALLNSDLKFRWDGDNYVASWRHVLQAYAIDSRMDVRKGGITHLTDFHVLPHKIKKMKVKYCTQVFSQRFSLHMRTLAMRPVPDNDIDQEAIGTAILLQKFDQLFDSVNGKSSKIREDKPLLAPVCSTSNHVEFWGETIRLLESMAFVNCRNGGRTPSLINWGRTLRNIITLWNKWKNLGFKSLVVGNLNQDPLENLFGSIRSYGYRNINPTCSNFVGVYKSLLLSGMVSSHSIGANCEEDHCELLDNLKSYISNSGLSESFTSSSVVGIYEVGRQMDLSESYVTPTGNPSISFAACDLMKKLGTMHCNECRSKQQSAPLNVSADVLQAHRAGEVDFRGLVQPSDNFTEVYMKCRNAVLGELPNVAHRPEFLNCLRALASQVDFRHITCNENHDSYKERFCQLIVSLTVTAWVKTVNRFLRGQDTTLHEHMDKIQKMAFTTYTKRRKQNQDITLFVQQSHFNNNT